MALDKSIKNGREHRQPYRKEKSIDYSCRNHGRCPQCKENRMYAITRSQQSAELQEKELIDNLPTK